MWLCDRNIEESGFCFIIHPTTRIWRNIAGEMKSVTDESAFSIEPHPETCLRRDIVGKGFFRQASPTISRLGQQSTICKRLQADSSDATPKSAFSISQHLEISILRYIVGEMKSVTDESAFSIEPHPETCLQRDIVGKGFYRQASPTMSHLGQQSTIWKWLLVDSSDTTPNSANFSQKKIKTN